MDGNFASSTASDIEKATDAISVAATQLGVSTGSESDDARRRLLQSTVVLDIAYELWFPGEWSEDEMLSSLTAVSTQLAEGASNVFSTSFVEVYGVQRASTTPPMPPAPPSPPFSFALGEAVSCQMIFSCVVCWCSTYVEFL